MSISDANHPIEFAIDVAVSNGVFFVKSKEDGYEPQLIALTLLPSLFPKSQCDLMYRLQSPTSLLYHRAAIQNPLFLQNHLQDVNDDFTQRLLAIHKKVLANPKSQQFHFTVFRSDYILDAGLGKEERLTRQNASKFKCKQVEVNTIASGMGPMSDSVRKTHRIISNFLDNEVNQHSDNVTEGIVEAFAATHHLYVSQEQHSSNAYVLFVTMDNELNVIDQRRIEFELLDRYGIRCIRFSLTEMTSNLELNDDMTLSVDGKEVSIVYFRSGYNPHFYETEEHWKVREKIELSQAIKSPSAAYQLAGSKVIQCVLSKKEVLQDLLQDSETVDELLDTYAPQYSLASNESKVIIQEAIANPAKYVLKTQREGGGHNVFDEQLVHKLKTLPKCCYSSYVLMERIYSPIYDNIILANEGVRYNGTICSELGIFGAVLGDQHSILLNKTFGTLLRSKQSSAADGGITAGIACLDSVNLC